MHVTGAEAGVDLVWSRKNPKPRVREMLAVGAARRPCRRQSPASSAPRRMGNPISQKKPECGESILSKWQPNKPYVSSGEPQGLPWYTVVAGHDDLSTGGVTHNPDYAKRLSNSSDRVCPSTNLEHYVGWLLLIIQRGYQPGNNLQVRCM